MGLRAKNFQEKCEHGLRINYGLVELQRRVALLDATKGRIERPAALVAYLIPEFIDLRGSVEYNFFTHQLHSYGDQLPDGHALGRLKNHGP